MKRLSVVVGILIAVIPGSLNTALAAQAKPAAVHALLPELFVPPAANRTAPGGAPSGQFSLANGRTPEVPSLRTRNSRTFATGEGNLVATIATQPINYRDATGNWQP